MTDTLVEEATPEIESPEIDDATNPDETGENTGTEGKVRDFTKTRELHEEFAAYVNEHSGLAPITASQVFAVTTLKGDFNKLPEQVAKRAERKAELEAEKAKYEGMSDEQIKLAKQADRADAAAKRQFEKAQEALEKAERLRAQATGSAADLIAAVEADTAPEPDPTPEFIEADADVVEEKPKRSRLGRNR